MILRRRRFAGQGQVVYDRGMALARLVVIEGPDLGQEFEIPLRGGGIGRGEGNVVQLSDLAVSRNHCAIELREGRLCLVDEGSRNKTLINGMPVRVHVLDRPTEPPLGAGEAAQGPVAAAIGNAVFDALGVRVRRLPLTPDTIARVVNQS